ncbi:MULTISPECIES: hypothetical protein [Paenibacillus]|uniref:hypothetical protein n=1 Tax=Paenibacillus TaxID=44249 RepID=UPI00117DE80E|nr:MULTISPECIES: hypothetical protein [Paenibacillus]
MAKTAEQRFLFYWSIAALFFCLLAGWLDVLALSACPLDSAAHSLSARLSDPDDVIFHIPAFGA